MAFDSDGNIKGLQLGSFGGGAYYENTYVITAGEIVESIYNMGTFLINQVLNHSGMGRFVKLNYIELDGK